MIRWLLIYCGLWMGIVRDLMGHYSAQWRVKINSVCLSKTRLCYSGKFQTVYSDGRTPIIDHSCYRVSVYRLSSVDIHLASTINHLSVSSSLFVTAMSTLATGRRLLPVGTAPVWCCGGASWLRCYSLPTPFTVSCCWHGAARDDLVSSDLRNMIHAFFGKNGTESDTGSRIRHIRSGPILAVRWP